MNDAQTITDSALTASGLVERLLAAVQRVEELAARAQASPIPQRFFGVAEAAAYSGLSEDSIRRMIHAGDIKALRPCRGKILIDRQQLDAVILGANRRVRKGRGIRRVGSRDEVVSVGVSE